MEVKLTIPFTKDWDHSGNMFIRKTIVDYKDTDKGYLLGFINRNTDYKIRCNHHREPESMQATESITIALVNYNGKIIEVESKWIEIL